MAVGAALVFTALNYHVIRSRDGMHLVPKIDATLASTYVDVRSFGPGDWADHRDVFFALAEAERTDLLESAALDALRNSLDALGGEGRSR
jgi:hypothetical protein